MRRTLLFSAAILTFACGHTAQQSQAQNDTSSSAASAQPGTGVGSAGGGPTQSNPAGGSAAVTLVGCLKAPAPAGVIGTTGSAADDRARARATGNVAGVAPTHGGESNARFTLTNAAVESGGVGANGAGGSGGSLIGPGSSVELDGVPADAHRSVDKQVRVTGRIDAAKVPAAGGAGSTAGSASTRDDVRANSTTVASGDADNPSNRHVTVETVQVIAESCIAR